MINASLLAFEQSLGIFCSREFDRLQMMERVMMVQTVLTVVKIRL